MDLNGAYSTGRKGAAVGLSTGGNQSSSKQGNISANYGPHYKTGSLKQRSANHNAKSMGAGTGPMQLEPNPVFSIIEEQMDKMNKRTQEREQHISEAHQKREHLKESNSTRVTQKDRQVEYVSFVDGSNVMQLQKMAVQSSFESRHDMTNETEEDQIVAYSGKRKNNKQSKSLAKKASPKNVGLFQNANVMEMGNIWSKYRRNKHDQL